MKYLDKKLVIIILLSLTVIGLLVGMYQQNQQNIFNVKDAYWNGQSLAMKYTYDTAKLQGYLRLSNSTQEITMIDIRYCNNPLFKYSIDWRK